MEDLAHFHKLNAFFFGDEKEKSDFYLKCICPFMEKIRHGAYFATREWNGGPNVEIVYAGEEINPRMLARAVKEYCKSNELTWTPEQIQRNLLQYKRNQKNLLKMEKKIKIPILARNNLRVIESALDMGYYKKIYNSSDQLKLHFESKFILQPLIIQALENLNDKKDMCLLVMKLFQMTMNLFEEGEKFGSMIFFSNIEGVMAIAKDYGKEEAFRQYFTREYKKYDMAHFDEIKFPGDLEEGFRKAWRQIYDMCEKMVEEGKLFEDGFYRLEDQEKQMKLNIRDIDSAFHREFRNDEHLHEIVSGKIHLTFRSVTNILYNIMPALNISFLEKNFCCYAIVHYIMEKYDTSWQEIMSERVI